MDLTIDRLMRATCARLPGPPGRAWRDSELTRLSGFVNDILGRVGEDTERLEEIRRHRWHLTSGATYELRDSVAGLRALLEAVPRRPADRAELITSAVSEAARIQALIDHMGNLDGARPGPPPVPSHRR